MINVYRTLLLDREGKGHRGTDVFWSRIIVSELSANEMSEKLTCNNHSCPEIYSILKNQFIPRFKPYFFQKKHPEIFFPCKPQK